MHLFLMVQSSPMGNLGQQMESRKLGADVGKRWRDGLLPGLPDLTGSG